VCGARMYLMPGHGLSARSPGTYLTLKGDALKQWKEGGEEEGETHFPHFLTKLICGTRFTPHRGARARAYCNAILLSHNRLTGNALKFPIKRAPRKRGGANLRGVLSRRARVSRETSGIAHARRRNRAVPR